MTVFIVPFVRNCFKYGLEVRYFVTIYIMMYLIGK